MDHDAPDAHLTGHGDGLAVALRRDLPHQRIDGAGAKLGKGGMEPQLLQSRRFRLRRSAGIGILQHHRLTKGGDLKAQTVSAGQRGGMAVDPRQVQLFPQHGTVHRRSPFSFRWVLL